LKLLRRKGVGRHGSRLSEFHPTDIRLIQIGAQPDMIKIGYGDDGCAGRDDFTQFCLPGQNDAIKWRVQGGINSPLCGLAGPDCSAP